MQPEHLRDIARMCGTVAVLLVALAFFNGGGHIEQSIANSIAPGSQMASIFPCSWFGDCTFSSQEVYGLTANTTSIAPGQPVTLNWAAYVSTGGVVGEGSCMQGTGSSYFNCSITGVGAVGTPCVGGYQDIVEIDGTTDNVYSSCVNFFHQAPSGSVTVYPTTTTTYSFCATDYWGTPTGDYYTYLPYPTPCPSVTINVVSPPITADMTSNSPVTVGQSAVISFHADSSTLPTRCQVDDFNSHSLYEVSTCPSSANAKYTTPVYTVPGTYAYQFWYIANGGWIFYKTINVVANPATSGDQCTDIPNTQTVVPDGCVTPSPAPGTCTPTGGSYSSDTNTCSCPAGKHLSGTVCVVDSSGLCANGLADTYAPSCTCPAGQVQSGSLCAGVDLCSNISGAQSSAPANGHTNGDGTCSCNNGYTLSGGSCIIKGVISSFTANPSRVQRGNPTKLSWSTTNMKSCSVVDSSGNTISSLLNGTNVSATINQQTIFTLNCIDVNNTAFPAQSITVNIIPQTIEQ